MPNRILRDWTSSETMDLVSPFAEVFFTRLIMKADDYGSFYANPKLIKSSLFPLREYSISEINSWIEECEAVGLIAKFEVDGKYYIRILNFGQRLRTMKSTFPQPVSELLPNVSKVPPETKRNEDETKETGTRTISFVGSYYQSAGNAFELIKQDELLIEQYQMSLSGKGIRIDLVSLVASIRAFLLDQQVDPQYFARNDVTEVRKHLGNWLRKKTGEDFEQYKKAL